MSLSRHEVTADIAQAVSSSNDYEEVLASVAEQAATVISRRGPQT